MPHVIVKLWPGKSEQHKILDLLEAITKNVMDILHYGDESVSVVIWKKSNLRIGRKRCTNPTSRINGSTLYKKPGYDGERAIEERRMEIKRVGTQPSAKGPSEWFTVSGGGSIDLFQAPDPALVQGASVTFEPGARTAWHTHPLGQTLIVTAGCGWAQREGGPIEEIRPGDVVWFSPGEKHWHGATPDDGHDTHRHSREKRRQGGRLDGARQRPSIPKIGGERSNGNRVMLSASHEQTISRIEYAAAKAQRIGPSAGHSPAARRSAKRLVQTGQILVSTEEFFALHRGIAEASNDPALA